MLNNPWLSVGGVATSICRPSTMLSLDAAASGDVLVLTKPLGTQVAVNAYIWLDRMKDKLAKVKMLISDDEVVKAFEKAVSSMTRLNKTAASLMHKFGAHAATDVGGYGLLGAAKNLAKVQKCPVTFILHNLPILAKMSAVSRATTNLFGLTLGMAPEISGGLLIAIPREDAANFCKEIERVEGCPAWIVGIVENGDRTAKIIDKPRIIDIPI